jgi:hypothetical protein
MEAENSFETMVHFYQDYTAQHPITQSSEYITLFISAFLLFFFIVPYPRCYDMTVYMYCSQLCAARGADGHNIQQAYIIVC